ncbi:hypothetical protein [Novosphingobium sp. LASN5T]|uniref:hypothetical protein n=1 Tax=Novosphingobium sp. LASN5T TaxID=2491021 RepID=UPI000F5E5886|nr:hypothetical protein [Novosphingobium sp. LASN5T]RQW44678.1 hypothetical protein EH199_08065 [Novosphingobium sp. LASN5T]
MNPKIIAVTRKITNAALAATMAISKAALAISLAANKLHNWVLDKAADAADLKVAKAYRQIEDAEFGIIMAKKLKDAAWSDWADVADRRDAIVAVVNAEKDLLLGKIGRAVRETVPA